MDPYSFPPIAAVLDGAYSLIAALVALIEPLAGASSTAVAIVIVTIAVRACLIPVGVSQARAERTRRRLAPMIADLRRRYGTRPDVLRQKTLELYAREKASPLAGCLPLLAQAPVLSIVYGLFALPRINGHANSLLGAQVGDATLGTSLVAAVQAGTTWPEAAVYLGLLVVIAGVAWFSRRFALRTADAAASVTAPAGMLSALSWLPFVTVLFAAIAPLAAAVYLAVTPAWTFCERSLLRRLIVAPPAMPSS